MKLRDQRGVAVLEVALVIVVVAAAGIIGARVWRARHQQSGVAAVATAPNGNVDNTTNTLLQNSSDEASAGNLSSKDDSEVTATSSAAADIERSYNENSF